MHMFINGVMLPLLRDKAQDSLSFSCTVQENQC